MIHRFLSFTVTVALGATVGWAWAEWGDTRHVLWAFWAGSLVAAFAWVLLDAWRAHTLRSWIRRGNLQAVPELTGWWGIFADRASRLLKDRALSIEAGEQRLTDFLSAIQASPNGVVMLDAEAQIEWCNQTAAAQLGIHPERDLRQRIGNLMRDPVFTEYMARDKPAEPVLMDARNHRLDRPVRISVQRHPYGEGKQLLLTRDITLIEQAEAMRRDFVANVSHEIRTPLQVLSGFIETIQTLPLSPAETSHYVAMMAVHSHRMQVLVDDLLTLSRIEGSPAPGMNASIPLSHLFAQCEQEARALSATLGHAANPQVLAFELPPLLEAGVLQGEASEVQSALSNLVSNAVRYTPAGGTISVTAETMPEGILAIMVQDTGVGISEEHLPRLTERFYRVDGSRSRESGGTGLGLAIVKHVMHRHGGQLLIASELGQGSKFTLRWPAERWRLALRAQANEVNP